MFAHCQKLRCTRRAFVALVLAAAACASGPRLFQECIAGDGPATSKPKSIRTPKLREVVEVPEDYLGKEFTYTAWISTNSLWMKRVNAYFFLLLEDAEGSRMPSSGISPDSTVNLIRFIYPVEEGRKLFDQMIARDKYEARTRFKIERERNVLGNGWVFIGRISSIEVLKPATSR